MPEYMESTWEEEEVIMCCALRFDGYKYEEEVRYRKGSTGAYLSKLIEPVVNSFTLHQDNKKNFAAFFGLQRFLGKWGGEHLTPDSREHLAYRFLFLHLYSQEIPERYRFDEHYLKWESDYRPRAELLAARIRETFMRKVTLLSII